MVDDVARERSLQGDHLRHGLGKRPLAALTAQLEDLLSDACERRLHVARLLDVAARDLGLELRILLERLDLGLQPLLHPGLLRRGRLVV